MFTLLNVLSEEDFRFSIFQQNMEKAKLYNKLETGTAVYGATQFADMTGKIGKLLQMKFLTELVLYLFFVSF